MSRIPQTTETQQALAAAWSLSPWDAMHNLLALGYTPVAVKAREKRPPFKYGTFERGERAVTPEVISEWQRDYPNATNVGVFCGPRYDLLVIEYDTKPAGEAFAALGGDDVTTPRVQTARGQHVHFHCPPDITKSLTGKNAIIRGLDVKASGLVLVPPSIHPSGTPYTEITPLSTRLAPVPPLLLELIRAALAEGDSDPDSDPDGAPTSTSVPTTRTAAASNSDSDTAHLWPAIEAALGVTRFNSDGWSNSVRCPFHDDHKHSAVWTHANGGQLYCHAGCTPRPGQLAHKHGAHVFFAIDVARAVGIPLFVRPRQSTPAPLRGLGQASANASPAMVVVVDENENATAGGQLGAAGNYSHFVPTRLVLITSAHKLQINRRGPASNTYRLADIAALVSELETPVYRALTVGDLARPRHYRAKAYAPLVAGTYTRRALGKQLGVSASATRNYDDLAGVHVTPNMSREWLTTADAGRLPEFRRELPYTHRLEATDGTMHAPTPEGLRDAIAASVKHDNKAGAWYYRRLMNTYTPPEFDDTPIGLPVQVRRALIRDGKTNLARIVDALLLAGVTPSRVLTTARIVEITGRYGIGKSTVYRELARLAALEGGTA